MAVLDSGCNEPEPALEALALDIELTELELDYTELDAELDTEDMELATELVLEIDELVGFDGTGRSSL